MANRQRTDVTGLLSRRSWGGTRDKPKNVCVGGYNACRPCEEIFCTESGRIKENEETFRKVLEEIYSKSILPAVTYGIVVLGNCSFSIMDSLYSGCKRQIPGVGAYILVRCPKKAKVSDPHLTLPKLGPVSLQS